MPTLATAFSGGSKWSSNSKIYGTNTNSFVLNNGNLIEIVINNFDGGQHPLHAHGHHVQLVYRNESQELFGAENDAELVSRNQKRHSHSATARARSTNTINYPAIPMRRDTWTIAPNGQTRIRFIADNPGVWLLHCHMDWHVEAGLTVVMVEAPEKLQEQTRSITQMTNQCRAQGIPTEGNAVGNADNWLDLTGEVTTPPINNG